MRTIKLTRSAELGGGQGINLSTEVIVDDDVSEDDAKAAGFEAQSVLTAFLDGVNEAPS